MDILVFFFIKIEHQRDSYMFESCVAIDLSKLLFGIMITSVEHHVVHIGAFQRRLHEKVSFGLQGVMRYVF